MRMLAALMCSVIVLTTVLFAYALIAADGERSRQPAQLDFAREQGQQLAVVPGPK